MLMYKAGVMIIPAYSAAVFMAATLCSPFLHGQAPNMNTSTAVIDAASGTHLEATGGRPIKNLVFALAGEHGWVVDYEDVPIEASSAFSDTSTVAYRSEHSGRGYYSLKNRSFVYDTSLHLTESTGQNSEALSQLLAKYDTDSNPDYFTTAKEPGGRISVVGKAVFDDHGNLMARQPVLDRSVTLSSKSQTLFDAITVLIERLNGSSGHLVVAGTMPVNLLNNTYCRPPAGARPARYDLASILDAAPFKLVWILLYDRNADMYVLNILTVQRYSVNAAGARLLSPVTPATR